MSQPAATIQQRIRFEEVTPAHEYAAFIAVSIESLVAHLGLPLYEGYDGLDEMRLTFLTLPSGQTVTLGEYLNCPEPGTSIYVNAAMQNIPQIVFESCQQLKVSREEVLWFHPDWQDEIDRLYAEYGAIEKRPESSQVEESQQSIEYEPIDCFHHALRIYTREYVPATYWAMLQHNLGLAYQNRVKGDRKENLEKSIECFNKSLEIFTQDEFPEKWKINQDDWGESERSLELLLKQDLVKDIFDRSIPYRQLKGVDLSNAMLSSVNLSGANLSGANLSGAYLFSANLSGANLSGANLNNTYLSNANLRDANLHDAKLIVANLIDANLRHANLRYANLSRAFLFNADLSSADVRNTLFGSNSGISKSMKQDLIARKAIFDDVPGDRFESRIPVSR